MEIFARIRWDLFQQKPYFAIHWRRGDQLLTRCNVPWRGKSVQDEPIVINDHRINGFHWALEVELWAPGHYNFSDGAHLVGLVIAIFGL